MNQDSVLIIEDERDLRDALWGALKEAGFEVHTASDGEVGLLFALDKHPDMILLDMVLPKMHGNIFLERLRGDEWGKKAKVIILSNLDRDDYKERAQKYGVVDYLIKTENSLSEIVKIVQESI